MHCSELVCRFAKKNGSSIVPGKSIVIEMGFFLLYEKISYGIRKNFRVFSGERSLVNNKKCALEIFRLRH